MLSQTALLENEDIARVMLKPLEYLHVILNDEKSGGRAAALVLTKEDILRLKYYEQRSLNLPTTITRVEQQLGFVKSGIPGLEPKDLLSTYSAINSHGRSWLGIEDGIKSSGFSLDTFAAQFAAQGQQIISYIEKMDFARQLDLKVADLTIEAARDTTPTSLTETDQRVCITLAEFLKKIASQIAGHQQSAERLAKEIDTFSTTLSVELIPDINHKVKLASRSDLGELIKALETDIEQLTVNIDQKNSEYKTAVINAGSGFFFGAGIGLITGGVFGSKAENIRKTKNKMIHSKEEKVQLLKEKRPLAAAVRGLELLFEDMNIRLLDAYKSATHLKDLWALLSAYINSSANELAEIKDDQALLIFAIQFQGVVTPWLEIKGMTTQLLMIFDSALEQFQRELQFGKKGE